MQTLPPNPRPLASRVENPPNPEIRAAFCGATDRISAGIEECYQLSMHVASGRRGV